MRTGTSNRRKGKKGDGLPTRIDLACDQGLKRASESIGIRTAHTKKAKNCPWKAKMIRTKANNWQ